MIVSITCEKAISLGTQISCIKHKEKNTLDTVLFFLVKDVSEFFSAGKFSEASIKRVVHRISASYWWLKFEELVYIFENAKSGVYGVVYKPFNEAVIFEWIRKYDVEEREFAVQQMNEQKSKEEDAFYSLSIEQQEEIMNGIQEEYNLIKNGKKKVLDSKKNKDIDADYDEFRSQQMVKHQKIKQKFLEEDAFYSLSIEQQEEIMNGIQEEYNLIKNGKKKVLDSKKNKDIDADYDEFRSQQMVKHQKIKQKFLKTIDEYKGDDKGEIIKMINEKIISQEFTDSFMENIIKKLS